LLPELIQFQLPPQLATQPTVAIRPRAPQLHFAQLDLDRIQGVDGHRSVFRKQAERCGTLLLLVEHLQRLAPRRLLAVVDLAQIQHAALHHFAGLQTPTLFDAVVAVFLTVLRPPVASQEHVQCRMPCFFPRA